MSKKRKKKSTKAATPERLGTALSTDSADTLTTARPAFITDPPPTTGGVLQPESKEVSTNTVVSPPQITSRTSTGGLFGRLSRILKGPRRSEGESVSTGGLGATNGAGSSPLGINDRLKSESVPQAVLPETAVAVATNSEVLPVPVIPETIGSSEVAVAHTVSESISQLPAAAPEPSAASLPQHVNSRSPEIDEVKDLLRASERTLKQMEAELQAHQEAAAEQIRGLQQERDQAELKCAGLEAKLLSVSEELKGVRIRRKKRGEEDSSETSTQTAHMESRVQSLESELITTQTPSGKQNLATRIQRLEAKWAELKARLLPNDQELVSLRKQTEDLRAHVQKLEAALAKASKIPGAVEGFAHLTATEQPVRQLLPAELAQPLYHQTVAPLTVLLASTDIVLMNPKLDPRLRETAQEIKKQGQMLRDIIKYFTLPPDSQQSQ